MLREFEVVRGDTFTLTLVVTDGDGEPVVLDPVVSQLRRFYASDDAVDFDVTVDVNVAALTLDAETTGGMAGGVWLFDVRTVGAETRTLLAGRVVVLPEVTR